jgi:cob(I)alamin adenosyltransferase
MDKVNEAELPFLKGLEVLPLKEAQETISGSEKQASEVQKNITEARNFIAAKNLEVKRYVESASKPAAEEFGKLTERINAVAAKLSQFRKDTEARRKSVQMQEAGEKVDKADQEVAKLAETVEPYTKEDAAELSGEAAAEACDKLTTAAKAAQVSVDAARSFVAARNREVKEPGGKEALQKLQERIGEISKRLAESKKAATTAEGKFVHKKLLFELDQMIAGVEEELKKATDACAPLVEENGIEFLVANSASTLAAILREYASEKELSEDALFSEIGGTSEAAFMAWLSGLPEKLGKEEVNFPEERRKAIFGHLDTAKGGSINLEVFKGLFKRRFKCVKSIAATDSLEIAGGKSTGKIEAGDILEAVGMGVSKTDAGGLTRIRCKRESDDAPFFVSVKGNEGTVYLEEITAFSTYLAGVEKTFAETNKSISKANVWIH